MNNFIPYRAQGTSQCANPHCPETISTGDLVLKRESDDALFCCRECFDEAEPPAPQIQPESQTNDE